MEHATVSWQSYLQDFMSAKLESNPDASHDILHVLRVIENIKSIVDHPEHCITESVDMDVLIAAAYLHDVDMTPKDSPERNLSSVKASEIAATLLDTLPDYVEPFPKEKIKQVVEVIRMHSFSYEQEIIKFNPNHELSLEAKILQDADRLDALGVAGVARMFYVAGKMRVPHFHAYRPQLKRDLPFDDKRYVADHYVVKLSKLPGLMKTEVGKVMGKIRLQQLESFLNDLEYQAYGW